MNDIPEWEDRQKSIRQVIEELKSFEDQELIVAVSTDGGDTFQTVKLLGKCTDGGKVYCTLFV